MKKNKKLKERIKNKIWKFIDFMDKLGEPIEKPKTDKHTINKKINNK